jgi:hypothetical protein
VTESLCLGFFSNVFGRRRKERKKKKKNYKKKKGGAKSKLRP